MSTRASPMLLSPHPHFPPSPDSFLQPSPPTAGLDVLWTQYVPSLRTRAPSQRPHPEENSSRQLRTSRAPSLHGLCHTQLPPYISARACGEELERGETVDLHCLHLVGCRVHLGNNNVLMVMVGLPQLVPDRSQLLTVTTPGGIC